MSQEPGPKLFLPEKDNREVFGHKVAVILKSREFRGRLRRLCDTVEQMEDLAQTVAVEAIAGYTLFDGKNLSAWLNTIARNRRFDAIRKVARQRKKHIDGSIADAMEEIHNAPPSSPEDLQIVREMLTAVGEDIKRLKPKIRNAFTLNVLHGLSFEETAQILSNLEGTKVAAKTVNARVVTARRFLRSELSKREEIDNGD